jgi:hypothetical protein
VVRSVAIVTGPCSTCRFWKYKNTVHPNWGHCKRAQEQTETVYFSEHPEERPRFIAIGSPKVTGILATHAEFRCNEFQPK